MVSDCQVFITSLAVREKKPSFESLACTLLQEEERKKHVDNRSQHLQLSLMVK